MYCLYSDSSQVGRIYSPSLEILKYFLGAQWYFDTLHKQILDQHAPIKSRVIRPNQPPFMNSSLRNVAHRKAQ